jgi:hypothetical protein
MQTQEQPITPVQDMPIDGVMTPQDKIDGNVKDGVISEEAGKTLTALFSADANPSPADVERHKKMMDIVLANAASAGKRILH